MTDKVIEKYEGILAKAKEIAANKPARATLAAHPADDDGSTILETGVSPAALKQVADKISLVPENFHINPKMVGQLARRPKWAKVKCRWIGHSAKLWRSARSSDLELACIRFFSTTSSCSLTFSIPVIVLAAPPTGCIVKVVQSAGATVPALIIAVLAVPSSVSPQTSIMIEPVCTTPALIVANVPVPAAPLKVA